MEPLIDRASLQKILERGLITGKWSIAEFNGRNYFREIPTSKSKQHVKPSSEFFKAHPEFLKCDFRDLSAYKRANHRRVI